MWDSTLTGLSADELGRNPFLSTQMKSVLKRIGACLRILELTPHSIVAVAARVGTAGVFWRSGQTKVDGWNVTEFTVQLFREEYKVPLLSPEAAATFAATAEHVFPVLLVIGLASRVSALALLMMTLVIQIFVYPQSWPEHLTWATSFLFIIAYGPGRVSIDYLLRCALERNNAL